MSEACSPVSYTHLDVYKRQVLFSMLIVFLKMVFDYNKWDFFILLSDTTDFLGCILYVTYRSRSVITECFIIKKSKEVLKTKFIRHFKEYYTPFLQGLHTNSNTHHNMAQGFLYSFVILCCQQVGEPVTISLGSSLFSKWLPPKKCFSLGNRWKSLGTK